LYYLPQYFQVVLGYSPIRAGIFLIPFLVTQLLASWISGMIVSKTGHYRTIIYLGFSVWAIGCGCISTIRPASQQSLLVFYMLLSGAGAGQTLQTTTVAAQASVPRRDMSVVTAFRNFIRQLGGALTLAVPSTIVNNSLRTSMTQIHLSDPAISAIIDNPSILSSIDRLHGLNVTAEQATHILSHGYIQGFRSVFMLNASLAVVAVVVSILMIQHTELLRGDEEKLREEARTFLKSRKGQKEKDSGRTPDGNNLEADTEAACDVIEYKQKISSPDDLSVPKRSSPTTSTAEVEAGCNHR